MREILFRGYNKIQNKWYYGMLDKFDNKYLINDGSGTKSFVDEDSIGQYTGFEDMNGKRIFEGDIVSNNNVNVAQIIFNDGCWYIKYDDKERYELSDANDIIHVVGNVYEEQQKKSK